MSERRVPILKRILNRVTITGADDSVDPEDLVDIYDEFPFVEWGILLSRKSFPKGKPRFPSKEWLRCLYNTSAQEPRYFEIDGWIHSRVFPLSGHLCGQWVDDLCDGNLSFLIDLGNYIPNMFSRYQLNFHGEQVKFPRGAEPDRLMANALGDTQLKGKQFIFQCDGVNDLLITRFNKSIPRIRCAPFYDMSHGAGLLPETWPSPHVPGYCGYGGGLSPDNVHDEMKKINAAVAPRKPIWIDVETNVRSDDNQKLDLEKVYKFLEAAKPWVIGSD